MTSLMFLVPSLILLLASFYLQRWCLTHSSWAARHPRLLTSTFLVFVLIQSITLPLTRRFGSQSPMTWVFWVSYAFLGAFGCLFIYSLAADLSTRLMRFALRRFALPPDEVNLRRRSFLTVGALSLGSSGIGMIQASAGPQVYEIDVPLAHLPPEFEHFKIAQVSDLHVGPVIGRAYTQDVVNIVNALSPDAVALTGDFVDGSVEQLKDGTAPLADLKSEYGTYFVTGNHEYYSGAPAWLEEFKRLGMRVLLNEHVILTRGQSQIVMAGVTDYRAEQFFAEHASSPTLALKGAPEKAVKVLLAHQPSSYIEAHKAGVDLQLSGHTHGGQFFPWSLVVQMAHRYYKGLNRHENMWVYVNRGTGYWGPPVRFGVPSEITLIRLVRA